MNIEVPKLLWSIYTHDIKKHIVYYDKYEIFVEYLFEIFVEHIFY